MAEQSIAGKLRRLREGGSPRVLDLFAGCGGISLGFQLKGFQIVGEVEIDEHAVQTHATNIYRSDPAGIQERHARPRDIIQTEPETLLEDLGIEGEATLQIDVIVGGPPCQAFARVGRAKLREVADHPEAFLQDPRGNLYLRYITYVDKLRPIAILMENVPDALNYGGHNVAEETCEVLADLGYTCSYTLLNAVFYGVPQMRERMFLLAYRREVSDVVDFPEPTHWFRLPPGYQGSRRVALRTVRRDLFTQTSFYADAPEPHPDRTIPAVTAEQAIGDLPPITIHLEGKLKRGARRFTELLPYRDVPQLTRYQELLRNWPGLESHVGVYDHVIRWLPRDYEIFRRMNPGDQYPAAYRHALDLLDDKISDLKHRGVDISPGSMEYAKIMAATVPPYDPGKFPNKWRKMERQLPARTLMAHLGKDSYSHIHYDSEQCRTISVREAARLQSFPDGFRFSGTMNPAFRQIGNAVPPQVAAALAEVMRKAIQGEAHE